MRLSVITDEISQDLDRALVVCGELGLREVELREVGGSSVVRLDRAELAGISRAFRSGGFSCPVIASPFLKTPPHQVDWDVLERSFEAAHALDAGMVRTFSWLRQAEPSGLNNRLVEVLAEAHARTLAAGLTLALENEHACTIATGAEARPLLDSLPGLGLIWDPGNEAMAGSRPFPGGYEAVRDRVLHVHLKDVGGGAWVRIGSGEIDYGGQLRALADDGYSGCLSVETHYSLADGGREPATRECVAALRAIAGSVGVVLA